MARLPRPWYRRARGEWYATMHGKQTPLGVTDPTDEAAAWHAIRQLAADLADVKKAVVRPTTPIRSGTIPDLITQFLAEKRPLIEPRTLRSYAQHLKWLRETFPKDSPASLCVTALVRSAAGVESWGDTHRANVLGTTGAFLRWAGRTDEIPLPPKASRGGYAVIPEPVYKRCLNESRGDFRQLIRFLWLTGCRPGEATALTAEAVSWDSSTIRLREHKTRKKGKTRILYLAAEALEVLREQADKHGGEGILFRGVRGRPLSLQAMTMRFERLSAKVGATVTSYMFRHTWATRALKAGVPAAQVAAMLGHTSTAMVFKHYSHLCEEAELLKQQAERVAKAG